MGRLRLEPKEEKLEFVALKPGETSSLAEQSTQQKKSGRPIRVTCGSFSIEVENGFDTRLLGQVLRVVGSTHAER